jgi:anti-sigma factor RsiW
MNHDRVKQFLPAYADHQIGRIQRFFLRRHIASCPSCLAELEATNALRTTMRTNLPTHRAPPSLATRIGSALPRERAPTLRRRPAHAGLIGGGMAGAGLVGALAGVALTLMVVRPSPPQDPVSDDAVADHVRSMMADHLTDIATSDRHTVKPWLSARLELSPVVKDFAADGFPLVGGRLDYVHGHRAAAIVYRRDRHVINLFAFVTENWDDTPPRQSQRDGFNTVRWRMDGLTYIAVSDVEATQLMRFVHLIENS